MLMVLGFIGSLAGTLWVVKRRKRWVFNSILTRSVI